ncbi:unspecified product [Plasmodium ovale wallikeri]|uniref:Unspecified product n=1 Tax=Plasmodium ovale wallikeri TaxID=864142 RepID=A0A1A9AEW1_PLAOA|nr:unspecified product [Plasmodium ovale wallikeri]SBT56790.1 unspecified product [Plasmodium ovale wallikeri]
MIIQLNSKCADTLEDLTLTHFSGQELGHGSSSYDTDPTSERSDIGTKVGHSIIGVSPVLLTATALYTVSSWIRNFSGNNANSISNDAGEIEGFLANTQESGNMFFDGREKFISYQPIYILLLKNIEKP